MANSGKLVLCAYYNKDGHGHLTTVRPEGVVGDESRKGGRGPLFNDIGYFHKVQNKNFAFRSGVELHYYTPK